ncbi:MAG TPA: monofunctional biosynthetic peptidoglycan transglycosylase [Fibrobacteraceae bacterium]|nr:monofunctional biosynthetic peptidoglycan transglycosylase [Fibrobacteraceae bacterium]
MPKLPKFPPLPSAVRFSLRIANAVVRIVFLLFATYAILFSVGLTWATWKAYQYGETIIAEVTSLQENNPTMSKYMQALQDSSPNLHIRQKFVPLDSINPWLRKAVIASEDAGFYYHPGFDVKAIADALDANRTRGKTVFGGSTITQQTAKNFFLSSERSWMRKFKELAYALLMEKYLGKDRILELYLNYAQWGPDIFGCEVACEEYFHKPCSRISMESSINMAAVLASPGKHRPDRPNSQFMAKRRAVIYSNLFGPDTSKKDSGNPVDSTGNVKVLTSEPPLAHQSPMAPAQHSVPKAQRTPISW